ncbi:8-oxo-dGTP diphosphatase MutT [Motilimonas pumila]|uniref:8-oxo-dGTP diphosphatase n=1 Tax=Motilimonas pumila TaxID=2303987 RepID=A0A418YI91_9GAMM|nr:8-oxo-dGTP diphosphatase MutT [Motilimonas pumila]RJG50044.1 8-oxo-dGTP diphosphatase MutT [Motilimonas pumila]
MKRVHVAAGIIINPEHKILLSRRLSHQHQGGKWEFPGGKVEQGETVSEALTRELEEEVNLTIFDCSLFETISFDYPDKQVLLEFMLVTDFSGNANGNEGQEIRWVEVQALNQYEFPAANQPIVTALMQQFS